MSQPNISARRPYASRSRADQAAATRERVARAAAELFVRDGWTATTVAAVARHAEVSGQTVYNVFGTKAALLKAAYDVTLVGDADPVPLVERPAVVALYQEPDAAAFLRGYAALGRELLERVGGLLLLIGTGAAAGVPDLAEARASVDHERLVGTTMVARRVEELGALASGLTVETARDRIWTLNSVEVWHLLTNARAWSGDDYQVWIGDQLCAAVLQPSAG